MIKFRKFIIIKFSTLGLLTVFFCIHPQLLGQDHEQNLADKSELYLHLKNALVNPVDDPKLPRVLLIGDSISIGYTIPLRKLLQDQANVHRVPDNARNAAYGLAQLDKWLGESHWDVIHFNWGLWDICYRDPKAKTQGHRDKLNGTITATPEEYRKTLEKIVKRLKKTNTKLIWCATTPVPEGEIGRIKGDEVKYNLIADKIMRENNIAIDDLYTFILPRHSEFQIEKGNVHFTAKGYKSIAEKVAQEIEKAITMPASQTAVATKISHTKVLDAIREEAIKPTIGPEGRPLPLFSIWHMQCTSGDKFNSEYALKLISEGKHILPWNRFHEWKINNPSWKELYEKTFKQYAKWQLPITLSGQNFEYFLQLPRMGSKWATLPAEQNPGIIKQDGKIGTCLSPFASTNSWFEVGEFMVKNLEMDALQRYYPNPPRVILLNNNEATRLQWNKVEEDKRYTDKYGKNTSEAFKKQLLEKGWIACYSAMLKGIHSGLKAPGWKKNTLVIGYNAFSEDHLGRWKGWTEYSLYTTPEQQEDFILNTYEGSSPEWYDNQWEPEKSDYRAWSVQTEMMNLVFMQKRIYKKNPNYWFELSVWEGDRRFNKSIGKPEIYRKRGQKWSSERYAGSSQFGLWLLRPRALRLYIELPYSRSDYQQEFDAHLKIIENIYNSKILMKFWRWGKLVPNRKHKHIFHYKVPAEYAKEDRWFLLDCDAHPKWPWPDAAQINDIDYFPIALVMGEKGSREWLVYIHSPRGDKQGLKVTIPEFGEIAVDSTVKGSFYHVTEKEHKVKRVIPGSNSVWHPAKKSQNSTLI